MRPYLRATCVVLACLAGAACDSSHTASSGGPTGTFPAGTGAQVSGAAVFARSCRSCHSLIGNESERKQGGDLLGYHLTRAQLTSFTRVMPAHLTAAELRAVVDYVLAAQARGRG